MYTNPSVSDFMTQFLRDFPFQYTIQTASFSGIAASGQFVLNYSGTNSNPINWNATTEEIQTNLQYTIPGLSQITVKGSIANQALYFNFIGIIPPATLMTVTSNSLMTSAPASVSITLSSITSDNVNQQIMSSDITSAFQLTNVNINPGLFACQSDYTYGYLLLSAHYLVTNLRSSSQGINGQYNFLQASKGVGAVSEAFSIPQRILDNPYWSMLTKTNYGALYLQALMPQLCGQMFGVMGTTLP